MSKPYFETYYCVLEDNWNGNYFAGIIKNIAYVDTIDHKVPRAKGGLSTPQNCVCTCIKCNQDKDDMEYEEFIGSVELNGQV